MKKVLFIISIVFFVACNSNTSTYKKYLKNILKDPKSLVIYNEVVEHRKNGAVYIKVEYGAKNGYGGMGREIYYFKIVNGVVVKADDQSIYLSELSRETEKEAENNRINEEKERYDNIVKENEKKLKDSIENEKFKGVPINLRRPQLEWFNILHFTSYNKKPKKKISTNRERFSTLSKMAELSNETEN